MVRLSRVASLADALQHTRLTVAAHLRVALLEALPEFKVLALELWRVRIVRVGGKVLCERGYEEVLVLEARPAEDRRDAG